MEVLRRIFRSSYALIGYIPLCDHVIVIGVTILIVPMICSFLKPEALKSTFLQTTLAKAHCSVFKCFLVSHDAFALKLVELGF